MEPIQMTQADDGRTVTVVSGQQVIIRLPESPTTGYRWEPVAGIEVIADEYRSRESTASGAGGERVFTLPGVTTKAEIRLELKRTWGSSVPDSLFTLRLIPEGGSSEGDGSVKRE